jgi:hypothetical protein
MQITGMTMSGGFNFSQPSAGVPTSGLTLLLDAGNSTSYSGAGNTWTDLSPSSKNGNIQANVSWVSNGASSYFNFAGGANSWVTIPQFTALNSATTCSISTWFRLDTTPFSQGTWFSWGKTFDYSNGIWLYGETQPGVKVSFGASYNEVPALTTFTREVWLNVTTTFNGAAGGDNNDRVKMYVNSTPVLLNSSPAIGTVLSDYSSNANAYIGTWAFNPSSESAFEGNLAYTSVYNRVLSSTEATNIFDALKSRYGY